MTTLHAAAAEGNLAKVQELLAVKVLSTTEDFIKTKAYGNASFGRPSYFPGETYRNAPFGRPSYFPGGTYRNAPFGTGSELLASAKAQITDLAHSAVNNARNEIVKFVNAKDVWGKTPLHNAAFHGHKEIAKLLIENGAEVNVAGLDDNTPLHWAAVRGATEIAKLLLENGANANARDKHGHTPFYQAAWNGHIGLAALLWQHQLQNTVAGTIIGACAGIAAGCFLAGVSVPALPWILLGAVVGMAVGSEIEGYIKYSPSTWQERERHSQSVGSNPSSPAL